MKLTTYDPKKQKVVLVGKIIGDTLFKRVDPKKHFMHVCDGYGIQYNAVEKLRELDIKNIVIKETTGKEWEVKFDYFLRHSKIADYGNGKQYFLSLKFMNNHNPITKKEFIQLTLT